MPEYKLTYRLVNKTKNGVKTYIFKKYEVVFLKKQNITQELDNFTSGYRFTAEINAATTAHFFSPKEAVHAVDGKTTSYFQHYFLCVSHPLSLMLMYT